MNDEKERLRRFVLTILEHIDFPTTASSYDLIRMTNSLRILRSSASEIVEFRDDMSADQISEIDRDLLQQGLPSLTQMADRRHRELRHILLRNCIKSGDEWRLVDSYVGTLDSNVLSDQERDQAGRLLAEYESM